MTTLSRLSPPPGPRPIAFHDVSARSAADALLGRTALRRARALPRITPARISGGPGIDRASTCSALADPAVRAGRGRAAAACAARGPAGFLRHPGAHGPRRAALGGRAQRAAIPRASTPPCRSHSWSTIRCRSTRTPPPTPKRLNLAREFERNGERYRFLKWAAAGVQRPAGVSARRRHHPPDPPGAGGGGDAASTTRRRRRLRFPISRSAATRTRRWSMRSACSAWGVGGIEIETVVLGEPYILPKPEFVGVRLDGALASGITIDRHRAHADASVCARQAWSERSSSSSARGAAALTVPDRATLANMAPEYGATTGFWPVDEQTLAYLRLTGRSEEHVALVEAHARAAGLFRGAGAPDPTYDRVIADRSRQPSGAASPGRACRISARTPAASAQSFRARAAQDDRRATARRCASRRRDRHRRHHLLHQHRECARDDPCRPAGESGGGARAQRRRPG